MYNRNPMNPAAGMMPMGMGMPTASPAIAPAPGMNVGFNPTPGQVMGRPPVAAPTGVGFQPTPKQVMAGGPVMGQGGSAINPMAMMAVANMMRGGQRPAPQMQRSPMAPSNYNPMQAAMLRRRMRGM